MTNLFLKLEKKQKVQRYQGATRNRKSKKTIEKRKDKQRSTKHYTENK